MTPTQVETAARRKYNSTGDSFWSSDEIMGLIYEKSLEMAQECLVIERAFSSVTVADQAEYDWPTNVIVMKRMTVDGNKVFKVDDRDADSLTLYNSVTTPTGQPLHYKQFAETFTLIPAPSESDLDIEIFGYVEPQEVTITSTLEIPSLFHGDIVNGVVEEMCLKDENYDAADRFRIKWEMGKQRAKNWQARKKRGDSFASVKDEETMPVTLLGGR